MERVRHCPYCHAEVAENASVCPFCQHPMTFSNRKKIGSVMGIVSIAISFSGLILTLLLLVLLRYYWRDAYAILLSMANVIILLGLFSIACGCYAFLRKPRDSLGLIGIFIGFFLAVGLSFGLSVGMYFFTLLG